jgi:F-type H+-transporting ATPase subunit epsilon
MFTLTIVTPEKIFYEGDVSSLILPGGEGYLGVLTDHAPLITSIKPGKLTVRDKEQKMMTMAVSFGFFEITSNHATLLVDSAEYASEIDMERARKALARAKQRLADKAGDIDIPRAKRSMARARNRISVASSATA